MPFFAQRGYTCYAVSLRAQVRERARARGTLPTGALPHATNTHATDTCCVQGNSDCISNDKESAVLVAGTLDSHAQVGEVAWARRL